MRCFCLVRVAIVTVAGLGLLGLGMSAGCYDPVEHCGVVKSCGSKTLSACSNDAVDPQCRYKSSDGHAWSCSNCNGTGCGTAAQEAVDWCFSQTVGAEGTPGNGGATGSGGSGGLGGGGGSGGTTSNIFPKGPCDSYAADGGPCVAAHSTVRRLLSTYTGPLYQVRIGGSKSGTGGTIADIGFLADGFADGAAQDTACGGDACTISKIYDQSGKGNHLTVAPAGGAKTTPDNEADAKALPIAIAGHNVYGVHITPGIGYRNHAAVGTATGDNPETIYMLTSGDFYNAGCCFDYGNAETNSRDNGEGAAEAVYFGACTIWNTGSGAGPWVMGDLENGLWAGNVSPYGANQSVMFKYVTAMVKGDKAGKNHWTIKVGDAQSGSLTTPFDGPRPNPSYNPMRKEGAIILGIAGDNSNGAQGNFFEGVMTAHYATNAADDAVQANIVAAGYGL